MKSCKVCKIDKDLSCFSKDKRWKNSFSSYCKDCNKEKCKEYSQNNKQHLKNYRRTIARRFNDVKSRSKRMNREFSITIEEYSDLINKPCYYCSFLLGKKVETHAGLDRLDSSKGYVTGNCISCCKICNQTKNNIFTPEETKAMITLVMKMRGIIFG